VCAFDVEHKIEGSHLVCLGGFACESCSVSPSSEMTETKNTFAVFLDLILHVHISTTISILQLCLLFVSAVAFTLVCFGFPHDFLIPFSSFSSEKYSRHH